MSILSISGHNFRNLDISRSVGGKEFISAPKIREFSRKHFHGQILKCDPKRSITLMTLIGSYYMSYEKKLMTIPKILSPEIGTTVDGTRACLLSDFSETSRGLIMYKKNTKIFVERHDASRDQNIPIFRIFSI